MSKRVEIGNKLKQVLGNTNTYFQAPENVRLKYPCAIYNLDGINQSHANDQIYLHWDRYVVTFITDDPDNTYYDAMIEHFNRVRFDRRYVADGLYHFVYTIY